MIENFGIGVDIVDINRFEKITYAEKPSFYNKLFTSSEIEYCLKFKTPAQHFAGKFAIKESLKKSIDEPISFLDIETYHLESKLKIKLLNDWNKKYKVLGSISHDKNYSIAMVISEKINSLTKENIDEDNDIFEISNLLENCNSEIIKQSLQNKNVIKAIRVKNLAGVFGFEPFPGIRLGKEIGQLVRFFGIGGIFHSDELPNYGIESKEIQYVRKNLELEKDDAFLIITGKEPAIDHAINSIIKRIKDAKNGPIAETRAATPKNETVFLRPRPGASRMYPETDIPTIKISDNELENAKLMIPKSWDESISQIQNKYKINEQLSEQIFDSEYFDLFEKICGSKKSSPSFVASVLCSTITNLQRNSFDASLLKDNEILDTFDLLNDNKISKESIEIIFKQIMSGDAVSVSEAIQNASIKSLTEEELNKILDVIIQDHLDEIKRDGMHSIRSLMGLAMKQVRGQASGNLVNNLLSEKIKKL